MVADSVKSEHECELITDLFGSPPDVDVKKKKQKSEKHTPKWRIASDLNKINDANEAMKGGRRRTFLRFFA